jgi:hypothetical protein
MTIIRHKTKESEILFQDENKSLKKLVLINKFNLQDANLQGANLQGADLQGANLQDANLQDANLRYADLRGADLHYADLRGADLHYADLRGADLQDANLQDADLQDANLQDADLRYADLQDANLQDANLHYADLRGATNLVFLAIPNISLLSTMFLNNLPDYLTLELMRRDAFSHPNPELFDKWAETGECPYQNINMRREWKFQEKKELWKSGNPTMKDYDLIIEICKSQNWGIKGVLTISTL